MRLPFVLSYVCVCVCVCVCRAQAYRTQLNLFLSEVRSYTTLPLLKQHLLLYSSIDIQVCVCVCAYSRI